MDSENSRTHLRDVSFSSYLSTGQDVLVHNPGESVKKTQSPTQEAEISVFSAEKYFNMKLGDDSSRKHEGVTMKHTHDIDNRVDLQQTESRNRHGTPSVSSVSSWHSQRALLTSNQSESRHRKIKRRSFISGLRCNGSCSEEKSVYVIQNVDPKKIHDKEYQQETVRSDHRKQFKTRMQLQNESSSPSFAKVRVQREEYFAQKIGKCDDESLKRRFEKEKAREGPFKQMLGSTAIMNKGDIAMNLERKLSMLTWDAIPNAPDLPNISAGSQTCEDIESDASSDLFEIENISGAAQSFYPTTTSYEPSEASIEWSVATATTATAAVFSSANKDPTENITSLDVKTKLVMGKGMQTSRPTKLMGGCKSHKAVEVAELTAYRSNGTVVHQLRQPQKFVTTSPSPR